MSLISLKKLLFEKSEPVRKTPSLWNGQKRIYNEIDTFDYQSWGTSPAPHLHTPSIDLESQQPILSSTFDDEKPPLSPTSTSCSSSSATIIDESEPTTPSSRGPIFKIDARLISDAIIGLSDGLTVPFALTAGLSAMGNTRVVVYGGMAELIAGAISMGLGGYLGAKSENESYTATLASTHHQITHSPTETATDLHTLFSTYALPAPLSAALTTHLLSSPHLAPFLLQFHHSLPAPAPQRALTCALTISAGYFIGGFIPLLPYMFVAEDDVATGLKASVAVMVAALFVFGWVKTGVVVGWRGRERVVKGVRGGVEMVLVGALAAGAAMGLVVLFTRGQRGEGEGAVVQRRGG